MYQVVILGALLFAGTVAETFDERDDRIMKECKKEFSTVNPLQAVIHSVNASEDEKCFLDCMMKKKGLVDNGVSNSKAILEDIKITAEEKKDELNVEAWIKETDECVHKYKEDKRKCQLSFDLFHCITMSMIKNMKEKS